MKSDTQRIRVRNSNHSSIRKNQAGFTIVELLIAGLLGLVLIAGIIQLFVGSNRNYSLQNELANIQEDGRFAMIFLEEEIQKGGWVDSFDVDVQPAIDISLSEDSTTDKVAVSYKMQIDGVANRDCNGTVVGDGVITNTFFVGGTSGEEFMCQGNGGGVAQPLINGVKNFQVLYGVETNGLCSDGAVNQYMTKDQIVAAGGNMTVVSVRVALLIASDEGVLSSAESQTHDLLDQDIATNDKLAYRTFQQTIFMPNAIYSTAGNPANAVDCKAASAFS